MDRTLRSRSLAALKLAREAELLNDMLEGTSLASLPGAQTSMSESAAGVALSTDLICVFSCMQTGPDLSSGGVISMFAKASDIQAVTGLGEGLEFCAHYIPATQNPVLFGVLATTTPAALVNFDQTNVAGTSEWSYTGTPFDDLQIVVMCTAPCTIGTAGGSIAYSLDGGRTFSGNIRLGTATSYLIPGTGVTVNFTAGTMLLNDYASVVATSPRWGAQAITDAFTALKAKNVIPRLVVILGDIADQSHLQAVTNAILDYETSVNRFARVICSASDYYPKAVFQGSKVITAQLSGQTVTVAASGETYTRSAGSFLTDGLQVGDTVTWTGFSNSANNSTHVITTLTATVMTCSASSLVNESSVANTTCTTLGGGDELTVASSGGTYTRAVGGNSFVTEGFKVGMTVTFAGFTNAGNNGPHVLTGVSASALTVASVGLVNEGPVAGVTASGVETDIAWQTRIEAIPGSTPSTQIISHKTVLTGGRARRQSGIDGFFKRRPASWPIAIRWMQKDVKTSPARVLDGGLDGWTITTPLGFPEDHDERAQTGLLAMRIACLRTYAEVGINGVYCALPVTLDNDNAPLSRLQVGGVADIAANIVQSETTKKIQSDVELKDDGTIQPFEAVRIEQGVLNVLKENLLAPNLGGTDPGPRCSSVSFSMDRTVDLSMVGAKQPTETDLESLGYFEKFTNRVVVTKPAS